MLLPGAHERECLQPVESGTDLILPGVIQYFPLRRCESGDLAMSDAAYFAAREREERELARNAQSAAVRKIHQKLAERYAQLASAEKASSK